MADEKFHLVSNYAPTGDQPQAIEQLVEGVERGDRCQTLLGVTGSGKTFTMANVIARCQPPPRWCWPIIRRWRPSSAPSSARSSRTMRWSILFPTTITTSEAYIPSTDHLH